MKKRSSTELTERAEALILSEKLESRRTRVIAAWLSVIPMTLHRSSRFTVVGDLTLAIVILTAARIITANFLIIFAPIVAASVLLYWFFFRTYYDLRYFSNERLILLPPNSTDDILLHELLHVHLGHIRPMGVGSRVLAMTPIGPFVFWRRAILIEPEVIHQITARGWKNPSVLDILLSPPLGVLPMAAFMLTVISVLLI